MALVLLASAEGRGSRGTYGQVCSVLHGDSSSVSTEQAPTSNAWRWASRASRPRGWQHSRKKADGKDTPVLGTGRGGEGGRGKSSEGSRNGRSGGLVTTGRKRGHVAGVEGGWGVPRPSTLCDRKLKYPLECDGKPRRVLIESD